MKIKEKLLKDDFRSPIKIVSYIGDDSKRFAKLMLLLFNN